MRSVIATLPDVRFSLGRDLSMVKTCALYGDEVVLFSPTYCGTEPLLDFTSRPLLHQLLYLALLARDPGFIVGEKLTREMRATRLREAETKSLRLLEKAGVVGHLLTHANNDEQAVREIDSIVRETLPLSKRIEELWSDEKDFVRRARQLAKAEAMGLVDIHNIHDTPSIYFNRTVLKAKVATEISTPSSYGVLDERFISEFKDLSRARADKVKAVRLASRILGDLPGFSEATIEEIRDIRSELSKYVTRFRKAIIETSRHIESSPWDEEFAHEVERELQLRLHPAVAEIKEQVRTNSYLSEILLRATKNPLLLPASSGLGLLLSSAAHVPTIVGQVISGIFGAGLLALEAHKTWSDNKLKAERNEFFFYYRASVSLKRHRPRRP